MTSSMLHGAVKVELDGMTKQQAAAAILRYLRRPAVSILDPELKFEIVGEGEAGRIRVSSDYYVDGAILGDSLFEIAKMLDPASVNKKFASAHVDSFD